MQAIPVVDILDGVVVHGQGGHRQSYRPVESQLTGSAAPTEVLSALVRACNAKTAYVADLDGLMVGTPQSSVLKQLADQKIDLMIDAGIRSADDVDQLPAGDRVQLVLASETIPSVHALKQIIASHPNRRFVFSFDLVDDVLSSPVGVWKARPLTELATLVWKLGVSDWIVLDVRSVGMTNGPSTLARCEQLKSKFPASRLVSGGGIRNRSDLTALKQAGLSGVLLATALHSRSISEADLIDTID